MPPGRWEGIFPTQGSNPGLPHCRWILYHLSHREAQECSSRIAKSLNPKQMSGAVLSWDLCPSDLSTPAGVPASPEAQPLMLQPLLPSWA